MITQTTEMEREHAAMQRLVFSSVAHDLKTPLACIIGSLETIEYLKDQLPSEKRDALITSALTQAYRLNALFDTMLDTVEPE
jgi:K+-sensing histidine kinase KdpD